MKLGANGFPLGWSQEFKDTWTKIKNDPNLEIQKHYNRLDSWWKYDLTQDPKYVPADLIGSMTKGWYGSFCGSKPYIARTVAGSADVAVNYAGADISGIDSFLKVGSKIKFISDNSEYFIISITDKALVSGVTSGGYYYLPDATKDFLALGVQSGDFIIKPVVSKKYDVTSVADAHKIMLEGTNSGERNFGNGDKYEIHRLVFNLSSKVDGTAIQFNTNSSINFQPSDKVFYYPDKCDAKPGNDNIADSFGSNIIRYATYYDLLTQDQKLIVNDVSMNLIDILLHRTPVGYWDYDNYSDAWTAITMFALVIKNDFPAIYTKIINDQAYTALFNGLTKRFQTTFGGDDPDNLAMFWGGTNYDPATLRGIIQRIIMVENFEGKVYFPDLHRKLYRIGEGLKAYFLLSFADTFQWSDTQLIHTNYDYLTYDNLATFANLNKDPELWYMWDKVNQVSFRKFDSQDSNHSPHDDPYAKRATEAEWLSRKNLIWNDKKRGMTFFHTGRDVNKDSQSLINNWESTDADHNPDGWDFNLVRKNEWMIAPAVSYTGADHLYFQNMNTLIPFNCCAPISHNVQRDFQKGVNWVYTKAAKQTTDNGYRSTMSGGGCSGNLLEQFTEKVVYRCANGADLIIIRDTLKTPPAISPATDAEAKHLMELARYRHNFQFCVPITDKIVKVGDTWTWKGNRQPSGGEPAYTEGKEIGTLTTFVKDYSSGIYGMEVIGKDIYPSIPINVTAKSLGRATVNFLRIVPEKEQFGSFDWLHAFYARSVGDADVVYTKTATGIIAQVGTEKIEIAFLPSFKLTVNNAPTPVPVPDPIPVPPGTDFTVNVPSGTTKIIINLNK